MENSNKNGKLTGIERQLVVQYLVDGNVPVTLSPEIKKDDSDVHPLYSAVFPVAITPEKIKVRENGKILLENPSQSVLSFAGKSVKVEFYFNRVGLFFHSPVKKTKKGLELIIPPEISRIEDVEDTQKYEFMVSFYYECRTKSEINMNCVPWQLSELFSRPVWKSIPLENQKTAKEYLEMFVQEAKTEKNAGNGIQLIPICNFLTFSEPAKFEAIQNRMKPLSILYVDHERIVFGGEKSGFNLILDAEYALKMSFKIGEGPILSRDIFVTVRVNKIYNDAPCKKYCADCVFTSMQEEDMRFIYEKATKKLFN